MEMSNWDILRSRFENEVVKSHMQQWVVPRNDKSVKITTTIPLSSHTFVNRYRGYVSSVIYASVNEDESRLMNRIMLDVFADMEGVTSGEIEITTYVILQLALTNSGRIVADDVIRKVGTDTKYAIKLFDAAMLYLEEMRLLDDADKMLLNVPIVTSLITDHWLMSKDRCAMLDRMGGIESRIGHNHAVMEVTTLLKAERAEWEKAGAVKKIGMMKTVRIQLEERMGNSGCGE